jgi:L-lysine 6-transaminase
MPLGFNHPKMVTDEVIQRLGRIAVNKPANSDAYTPEMAAFVETFFRTAVPDYFRYAFFIEGGALAVENAIKAAIDWKVQKNFQKGISFDDHPDGLGKQVIHFKESFHGRSGYTLSLTESADPNKTKWFPKFDWPRIVNPKITFPLEGKNLENTIAKEKEAFAQIERALHERRDDIACLIIEPIQGEGGDNHFRSEFFQQLRTLADLHEFLLIFDEVQTGLGLTGKMWAHEHFGVHPDLLAFGKKTQVCGILAGPRLDEIESNVFHTPSRINSTWGGNLIDMVRCQLYLEIYEEENLVQRAADTGELLLQQLHALEAEFPGVIENVRGHGLFCAFDLTDRIDRKGLIRAAHGQRLIILPSGRKGIRFRPPLSIEPSVLVEGLSRLRKALHQVLAGVAAS